MDGGYRVYRTVPEGVHGYFDSDKMGSSKSSYRWSLEHYKYDYIEGYRNGIDLQIYRISLQDNELIYQPIDSATSRYEYFRGGNYKKGEHPYNILLDHDGIRLSNRTGIRDRDSGEVIASLTNYVIGDPWGWYFSFPDGGKGCIGKNIRKTDYFTKVIPSKVLLKEKEHGVD